MVRKLLEYARQLLAIKTQTEKNTRDIEDLQRQMSALAEAVRELRYDVRLDRERARHEHQELVLRLENAMLRIQQGLPPQWPPRPGLPEE